MALLLDAMREIAAGTANAAPYAACFLASNIIARQTAPKNLADADVAYWASSCVSTLHSLIIVPLAYLAMEPLWFATDLIATTDASHRAIDIFIGYIIQDSLPLLWYRQQWSGSGIYICHHAASYICWSLMGVRGHGHAVAVGLLLVEATAPFVNGRYFLSMLDRRDGLLYVINGVLMAVSFFLLRIVFMGWLLFRNIIYLNAAFLALPASTVTVVVVGVGVGYPMQWLWFSKICSGLLKVLKSASKAPKMDSNAGKQASVSMRTEAYPVGYSSKGSALQAASERQSMRRKAL